ncbi:hypothetical protein [Rhizobium paknamense]|uniref:Uncharacterized protein n=1 Tax=Rhizobium paknamense TaxID=1206817 RepID=A0ABU0I8U3_9HYPH|nr:hypothetical protein [Rhizobium paknamense]MDQ0454654.1 hypothetical protein [Rhizobium paknamense]
MTNPQTGGSYLRNPDGSLTRIEIAAFKPAEPEQPAAQPSSETPEAQDETSAKKGKA